MTADRSLDEFVDVEAEEPADDEPASSTDPRTDEDGSAGAPVTDDDGSTVESTAESSPDSSAVSEGEAANEDEGTDRPASTYVWSPDGGKCDACGETVEERWRDGEDLVCVGCKEW